MTDDVIGPSATLTGGPAWDVGYLDEDVEGAVGVSSFISGPRASMMMKTGGTLRRWAMTKTQLIGAVSEKTGLPRTSVKAVFDAVMGAKGIVRSELKRGEKVTLAGFGTFYTRTRKARQARNPITGAAVKVGKRAYPAFKPSKGLKEALKK